MLEKGDDSKRNVLKVEFNLYYINTNLYTTFQANISSKDGREKSGYLNFNRWQ